MNAMRNMAKPATVSEAAESTLNAAAQVRPSSARRNARPITVCLLISSLEYGGAERQVVEMFRAFNRRRVRPIICSLSKEIPLADSLREGRENVHVVQKHGRYDVTTVFRVAALLRRERVDVVHAFLFDAEIVSRLAAPLAGVRVVIASERNSDYERPKLHKVALRLTEPMVNLVVANSSAGKKFTVRTTSMGEARVAVVHNGVDTERFRPDPAAGQAFRARLRIPQDATVVGMVGSYKRQKAHDVFLRMAAQVLQNYPEAVFLLVGGLTGGDLAPSRTYKAEIESLARALGIRERCVFLENEADMPGLYNACDVTTLLSRREGTPNVLLESMACGVPMVATRIADNELIIGPVGAGLIVPVDDPGQAAAAIEHLLANPSGRAGAGSQARQRACEFSLERAAEKLTNLYTIQLGERKSRSVRN